MSHLRVPVPDQIREQLDVLRRFNNKVDHLNRSGFAARYAEDIPQVFAKFDDVSFEDRGGGHFNIIGRIDSWLHDFNQDEIDAFVLTYRLFTQKNDPISISRLSSIYASEWMPPQGREYFEETRAEINDYLERAATLMFGDSHISVGGIVEVVIYGGMAHSKADKAPIFESWQKSGIMGFVWAEFFAYARFMLNKLQYIREINAQLLDAVDDETAYFFVENPVSVSAPDSKASS